MPKKKLLIVEDNQDSRELVVKVLKSHPYELIEAVDGEEGLKKATGELPDVILMDISLPKMNGYDILKELKSQKKCSHITIIAVTAHAMKGERERALEAGFDGYISKPIDVHKLPSQIEYFIKNKISSQ
ncbi:MAG: response regulator [Nitrospiraceae bacterium]|nr:response regulator [Nitrospiraceae bacterium]